MESLMGEKCGRILVVDDTKPVRDVLSKLLSFMGYEVVVASCGNDGLNLFLKSSFDLVLTDLQMPGMDGWSLARHIKDESSNTPVVLVTGEEAAGTMEKLKGSCIDCAIFKPFVLEDVQKTVRRMLGSRPTEGGTPVSVKDPYAHSMG